MDSYLNNLKEGDIIEHGRLFMGLGDEKIAWKCLENTGDRITLHAYLYDTFLFSAIAKITGEKVNWTFK